MEKIIIIKNKLKNTTKRENGWGMKFRPYEGLPKNNNSWAVAGGKLLMKDFYSRRNKADNSSGCHYGKIKQQQQQQENVKTQIYYTPLFYSAILCSRADSLRTCRI